MQDILLDVLKRFTLSALRKVFIAQKFISLRNYNSIAIFDNCMEGRVEHTLAWEYFMYAR